ncbi:N-acylglucosamine 2-epimerase [Microlunatus endophyticus]|uniref:N-acylglucosamine 2-epimerase n=1 Tax=Microlunatus endophyticus TaxID=1716077 RepID=A0A917S2E2_9ACTN|nr:AGE family epimerase/isomerase [Microlunatus endophyticus]GGL50406.1 N-acylglucosamine 2-epimerase [Microlunatus endophyticus]
MSTQLPGDPWRDPQGHIRELLEFAVPARLPEGFGRLDDHGGLAGSGAETMITARMGISFAVGSILFGDDDYAALARHAVDHLSRTLPSIVSGYDLCFTVAAAATATEAGISRADDLLHQAIDRWQRHFLISPDHVRYQASDTEDYIGVNVNMHAVEAMLAADHLRRDQRWARRALRLADTFINHAARAAGWMLPEHFAADLTPLPHFNRDRPLDEFRPYGVTPGHQLEWSRLLLELRRALGPEAPDWLGEAAGGLFDAAQRGFREDWGFVYTMEPDGTPVAEVRLHWVHVEAVASAAVLAADQNTEAARHLDRYRALAAGLFCDTEHGSWHHEIGPDGGPASTLFVGKPDIYHAIQGVLVNAVPAGQSLAERAELLSSGIPAGA